MFSQQLSKAWGLYRKDTSNAVPLKELDISIKVFHNIARVTYSQDYFNDTDVLLETEFFFPISPDACFDSFQATFNNTTIKGVVKEKEKAKEEYKEAIEQGRTAAYSEINKETGDIMKIQIGNIPQNTNISITYSYVQKLETSLNKFWCFRLFSTLTPRYNNTSNLKDFLSHDVTLLSSYPTISKDNVNAYPWKIQVEIHSPSPISFIKSPSHDIIPTFGNEKHTCSISLNPQEKHFPNKDFILLYSNGKEGSLDYLLTPFEDGYCAMVSMIADFYKGTNEQAFDNFVKAKEVENEHSMSTIRGEYIFLIDRSGSMQGDRITMARNSLVLFLKSLPKDSFFNVVSFGSSYTFLHNSSVAYSQESIDSSTRQIQRFDADMGGTEIYHALQKIFTTPPKPGYPRFVFLLTDGAVSNTQQVLNLILEYSTTTRIFTIGIGNGCSPELITKGATYGRGKEGFVTDNNQIFEKVISLLNASLSPCYSDLSLHSENFDAVVKSVSPNPTSIPFLINGQTVTFFLFLRKEAFQDSQKMNLQLRMYDSRIQKQHTLEICLDTAEAFENEMISKLGIHDMIKRLENEKDKASDNKAKEIMWMSKEDLKQALLEYSLKYGILCKETAFFCEISDIGEDLKNVMPAKIIVPTVVSHGYAESFSAGQDHKIRVRRKASEVSRVYACGCGKSYGSYPSLYAHIILKHGGEIPMGTSQPESNGKVGRGRPVKKLFTNQMEEEDRGDNYDRLDARSANETLCQNQEQNSNSVIADNPERFDSLTQFSSDLLSNPTNEIPNTFGSMLKQKKPSDNSMSFPAQQQFFKCDASYESMSLSAQPQSNSMMPSMPAPTSFLDSQLLSSSKSNNAYLDIIMKQKVEGYWDPSDQQIKQTVLNDHKLSQIPAQIQVNDPSQADTIWITILILKWLEIACKNDRKAWLLIYRKGCEWLKGQGVDYEAVKELGTSCIKV